MELAEFGHVVLEIKLCPLSTVFETGRQGKFEKLNSGGVMRKILAMSVFAAFMLGIASSSFAQTRTPAATKRQVNQQARIRQGVNSGELTRREAVRLEAEQAKVRAEKRIAKADGNVTPRERAKIQHDQNEDSRQIAKQKHDAQTKQ